MTKATTPATSSSELFAKTPIRSSERTQRPRAHEHDPHSSFRARNRPNRSENKKTTAATTRNRRGTPAEGWNDSGLAEGGLAREENEGNNIHAIDKLRNEAWSFDKEPSYKWTKCWECFRRSVWYGPRNSWQWFSSIISVSRTLRIHRRAIPIESFLRKPQVVCLWPRFSSTRLLPKTNIKLQENKRK